MPVSSASNLGYAALLLSALLGQVSCSNDTDAPARASSVRLALPIAHFDLLTQHGNSFRTGANLVESDLTPATLQRGDFGRLFHWKVDGEIYGQPLYISDVMLSNGRLVDLVLVATMNNSVYAFEAPPPDSADRPSPDPLWALHATSLGNPLSDDFFHMKWAVLGRNVHGPIGIVSTPVVDRSLDRVFFTVKSGDTERDRSHLSVHYRLCAASLVTGALVRDCVEIKPTFAGVNGHITQFDSTRQLQRPGLLEAKGRIYLAFGSHQDTEAYHGWVVAYDATTLAQEAVYCDTCGDTNEEKLDRCGRSCMGGIWQGGGGPASDASGSIYVMTGNGTFDKQKGDLGTTFVKLLPNLTVAGSWTPPNYRCLTDTDADLGSAGPLILDNWLIGGGKQGLLYALRLDTFVGIQVGGGSPPNSSNPDPCGYVAPPSDVTTTIQAAPLWKNSSIMYFLKLFARSGLALGYQHIHGAPVVWTVHDTALGDRILIYISAERDVIRAFEFKRDSGFIHGAAPGIDPSDTFESYCRTSTRGMPGGFLTLSANGSDPSSAILWVSMPRRNADALNDDVPGVLRAYGAYPNAGTKLKEIWNSDEGANPRSNSVCKGKLPISPKDELGLFAKFVPPTVSRGKLYLATFSNSLVVYGNRSPHRLTATSPLEPLDYDADVKASSLPVSAGPADSVAVSITITNRGRSAWSPEQHIRLGSKLLPDLMKQVTEGPSALEIRGSVKPGESQRLEFHIRLPTDEGFYYYQWQMEAPNSQATGIIDGWFGRSPAEQKVIVLRPDCAALRRRAERLIARLPAPRAEFKISRSESAAARLIEDQAIIQRCRLIPQSMQMDDE